MALQRAFRGPRTLLSPSTYTHLTRGIGGEDAVQRLTGGMSAEGRRAFWAAVLILDGRATASEIAARWDTVPEERPTLAAVPDSRDRCPQCSGPVEPSASTRVVRIYCSRACQVKAERARNAERVDGERARWNERRRVDGSPASAVVADVTTDAAHTLHRE
jgi:hypothetical protein